MGRKTFTTEQIIHKLREAEVANAAGRSAAEASKQIGVSEQTYYRCLDDAGATITGIGCGVLMHVSVGDYDNDCDADLADWRGYPGCMIGPGSGRLLPECRAFNFDGDSDVDLGDYAWFQQALVGG